VVARVMVCGSRLLPQGGASLVSSLIESLLASGRSLVCGCAAGADAAAVSAGRVRGCGASRSPTGSVRSWWCRLRRACLCGLGGVSRRRCWGLGVLVGWGGASVPLRARLVGRSLAAIRLAAAGGPGSGLVAVVSGPSPRPWSGSGPWWSCGSGSWSSVAAAVALGLPVVVVPASASVLCSARELPTLPSGPGRWVPAGSGVWARAWAWEPAPGLL